MLERVVWGGTGPYRPWLGPDWRKLGPIGASLAGLRRRRAQAMAEGLIGEPRVCRGRAVCLLDDAVLECVSPSRAVSRSPKESPRATSGGNGRVGLGAWQGCGDGPTVCGFGLRGPVLKSAEDFTGKSLGERVATFARPSAVADRLRHAVAPHADTEISWGETSGALPSESSSPQGRSFRT